MRPGTEKWRVLVKCHLRHRRCDAALRHASWHVFRPDRRHRNDRRDLAEYQGGFAMDRHVWRRGWGGFVEYARQTDTGLINQGWKGSYDSIFHANGALASGPIALCEVQGYVFVDASNRSSALCSAFLSIRNPQICMSKWLPCVSVCVWSLPSGGATRASSGAQDF
jgi:hypothetical protein